MVYGLEPMVLSYGIGVYGFGLRVEGLGSGVQSIGFRFLGFGGRQPQRRGGYLKD